MESTASLPRSEFMPSLAFRLMNWMMKIRDLFGSPATKLDSFGIQPGYTVIDYGCGPGRYLRKASQLVGENGKVYAVDIHELAIKCALRIKSKKNIPNIQPVKASGYFAPIPENQADLIYALDMFHHVSNPNEFLNELHRLIKPGGKLILEDGHQKRRKTIAKITNNRRWQIQSQSSQSLQLTPLFKYVST